jgi:alpha-amylase
MTTFSRRVLPFIAAFAGGTLCASVHAQATTNPDASKPKEVLREVYTGPIRTGWWNQAVFYQVFVRSFADATTGPLANDGIGDFVGLTEKLDYIQSLGANALWLMPITTSPSYHGYDTTDYRLIEPDYGTNQDFKNFMAECRKRNIRVIIDLVLNHCSDKHPWFIEAASGPKDPAKNPKRDWFIWRDKAPNWKGPWSQGIWHAINGEVYYGIFSPRMPDLNYRNEAVTKEMFDVISFWLKDMNIDGFRLDAIRHLIEVEHIQENTPETHAWLQRFFKHVAAEKPDAFSVGEVWSDSPIIATFMGDQMDSCFEFSLSSAILEAARTGNNAKLIEQIKQTTTLMPKHNYSTFLANHDQTRAITQLKGDLEKSRIAASLLLTLPGIPFLYYGEELGQIGDKPDENLRTPMQWTAGPNAGFSTAKPWRPPQKDYTIKNVQAMLKDEASLLNLYKNLIALRKQLPALREGGHHASCKL